MILNRFSGNFIYSGVALVILLIWSIYISLKKDVDSAYFTIFLFFKKVTLRIWVFRLYMSLHHMHAWYLCRREEVIRLSGTGVTDGFELLRGARS